MHGATAAIPSMTCVLKTTMLIDGEEITQAWDKDSHVSEWLN
jgi:hypothetical protein